MCLRGYVFLGSGLVSLTFWVLAVMALAQLTGLA